MRGGGCTVQQSLTPEALRVVQQAVSLAQQRGHAQVTPLHVATILLSSPAALLRAACLESHSHPLRCKALELCFNVALNRLPTSSSSSSSSSFNLSPYHHRRHHHDHPGLSNALVAAFKRTQAHQRRGSSVEVQALQQPLLVVKVELPQLVLSILDDPSVSRVMREAGFSSTQVKANVEKAVCNIEINSSSSPPSAKKTRSSSISNRVLIRDEEYFIDSVLDSLLRLRRKKSSVVIVGESLATGEALLSRIMQVSEEVADEALTGLQFANLSLSSSSSREEVEDKVKDLSDLAKGSRGAVIYMGDVERIADECLKISDRGGDEKYCPLEHAIMELGRLVSNGEGRIWVTGIATYEGYMGCSSWLAAHLGSAVDVQPLFVPRAGSSLELSLSLNSGAESHDSRSKVLFDVEPCWELENRSGKKSNVGCADSCGPSFRAPRNLVINGGHGPKAASSLPSWLRKLEEEKGGGISISPSDQEYLELNDPCKWSGSLRNPSHKRHYDDHQHKKRLGFSWSFPSSSSSDHGFHQITGRSEKKDHSFPEFNFWSTSEETHQNKLGFESNSSLRHEEQMSSIDSDSKHCSADSMEAEYTSRFKELSTENLKALSVAMEEQVPWQKHIASGIACTVLQCRSGIRKKTTKTESASRETWLFFRGDDCEGKGKIAMELARLIFGSYADFVSISGRHLEKLSEAVRENSHRVILMEDVEELEEGIASAIRRGRIERSSGEKVSLGDAIIILTCEGFESSSGGAEKEKDAEGECHSFVLDLNVCANCEGMEWALRISDLVDGTFIFNLPQGI